MTKNLYKSMRTKSACQYERPHLLSFLVSLAAEGAGVATGCRRGNTYPHLALAFALAFGPLTAFVTGAAPTPALAIASVC